MPRAPPSLRFPPRKLPKTPPSPDLSQTHAFLQSTDTSLLSQTLASLSRIRAHLDTTSSLLASHTKRHHPSPLSPLPPSSPSHPNPSPRPFPPLPPYTVRSSLKAREPLTTLANALSAAQSKADVLQLNLEDLLSEPYPAEAAAPSSASSSSSSLLGKGGREREQAAPVRRAEVGQGRGGFAEFKRIVDGLGQEAREDVWLTMRLQVVGDRKRLESRCQRLVELAEGLRVEGKDAGGREKGGRGRKGGGGRGEESGTSQEDNDDAWVGESERNGDDGGESRGLKMEKGMESMLLQMQRRLQESTGSKPTKGARDG